MSICKAGSGLMVAAPLFFLLLAMVSGCSLHSGRLPTLPEGPEQVVIEDVPFHAQEQYLCGPASLAMVLGWSGLDVSPDALVDSVYTPDKKGSFQSEMITAARRRGRIAYPISGQEELVAELAGGTPVLVLQNLALSWAPQWHYAVVIGYDMAANEVILHTGVHESRRMSFSVFENTWGRSDFWGLLVLPPDRLPVTAREQAWLEAALGLERAQSLPEARTAYMTATRQWPESYDAWMGAGNTGYTLGDKSAAAEAFRRATEIRPDNGIAFNNLAHVLSELGRREEALQAARRAVAIGGPHVDVFRRTLSDIQ